MPPHRADVYDNYKNGTPDAVVKDNNANGTIYDAVVKDVAPVVVADNFSRNPTDTMAKAANNFSRDLTDGLSSQEL